MPEPISGFSFRGRHCSEFGIYIKITEDMLAPPRREGRTVIPGRSGYRDGITGNIYDERRESIFCTFIKPEGKTVSEVCREIAYWTSGTGRLIFDKEPDKYYTANLYGAPPSKQLLQYGTFTLTFSINPPFAFGKTVTQDIANGSNAVTYDGTADAPCVIVLHNLSNKTASNITITAVKRTD